jgi:hypothetical protein
MNHLFIRHAVPVCAVAAALVYAPLSQASPLPQSDAAVQALETGSPMRVAQNSLVARPGANSGELAAGDAQLSTGEYQDTWEFTVTQAGSAVFSLSSADFDTYLMVRGPGGLTLDNDDRVPGDLNSELAVQFPMAGTYQVIVTSYQPGEVGRYNLQVSAGTSGTSASSTTQGRTVSGGAIAAGQTVNGTLGPGDTTLNSGEFTETWLYTGSAGELLTVHLDSSEFDPYLMIRGPAGFTQDNDDRDSGVNLNSTLAVTLPTAGEYRIIATTYQPGEQGDYTLQVAGTPGTPTASNNQLRSGATLQGDLSTSDGMLAGRQFFDVYTFRGTASERALVSAGASGFPVLLRVIEPGGQEHVSQATASGGRAEIAIVLPSSGEYTVHVSSQSAGSTGPYTVGLVTADTSNVTPVPGTSAPASGDLVADVPVNGSLAAGDSQLSTGEFYDVFDIPGVAGQTVTFEMTSQAIDPYLFIRGPGNFALDNDDGAGFGLNSRLQVTFPQNGTYSLNATSYAANEVGAYSLVMRAGSMAQNAATGRVYAVLGGITNYTTASRLEGCAEDATSLFTTLQQSGLLAPQSVVLTDNALTRDALRRAFQSVGAAMSPDDVFVFFYSGHGNQISGSEFDGNDETLVLYDGEFRDDEMADLFDLIPGRVAIIALDSCFSGGFARDVISEPGRMGIFSSEEDVTSNVAVRFAAGGFLSYFFRNGIGGAADIDPVDGAITAGELAQYLRQQWAQHMLNERTETSSAENAWQNLVIDRGSVKVSDVIMYNP